MKTEAMIRDNMILNVNEEGLKKNIEEEIQLLQELQNITDKKLNVLVIGGSSGYGLATRIVLAEKSNAKIVNVSFEREAKGRRKGSFGYYNNLWMKEKYPQTIDINGDAFSNEIKQKVIEAFKEETIDLVVYSLASPVRVDPITQKKHQSSLKPIGETYSGLNIDLAQESLKIQSLSPASKEEIQDTIKVMGGEDYYLWALSLYQNKLLSQDVKFVAYTYIGPKLTHAIYKDGTLGVAKRDLEKYHEKIQALISPLDGKSYISQSKAVITKASMYIPTMALYASALFKVMKAKKTHESIVEHKYRLFKDYIFNDESESMIPLDAFEMDPKTQHEVSLLLNNVNEENFKTLLDFDDFKKEFVKIHGF